MPDYESLTAAEIAEAVGGGRVSAVDIVTKAIALAKSDGKTLNAFVTVCEEKALAQAAEIDRQISRGESVGPLAGVPVAIKDNICYRDYPTTCASRMLENYVSPYDATSVTKLLRAGAVIIGKTNMDEFAMGSSSETSYFGPVRNPSGEQLVPGGSSGGSAAAIAKGIVPVAIGSDTGGSVRQPASFCGIFGLKPTYGGVSRYGLVAYGSSLDQIGPMARSVDDLALVYSVICGHDPMDATSAAHDHPDYRASLVDGHRLTIGVPKEYFAAGLDSEVGESVRAVIERLKSGGHRFVDISLPMTDEAIAMYYIIVSAEASSNLARYDGVRYGLRVEREELADMYASTRAAGFGPEVKRKIVLGTYVLSAGYYDEYYGRANSVRALLRRDFEDAFARVDLIISPTSPTPPFELGEKINDPLAMYLSDVYTVSANLVGIPAISVPCGKAADNRPMGVQFMARRFGEPLLFQVAHEVEEF